MASGSWPSPITSQRIAAGALRLSQPRIHSGWVYWVEGRPLDGGRQVVVRRELAADGPVEDVTPEATNVRSRVHEYGGGDYCVRDDQIYYVDYADQRIRRCGLAEHEAAEPQVISGAGASCADMQVSPDGRWLVAVEERPRDNEEPENCIVAWPLFESAPEAHQIRVADGWDFFSFPTFSPDGSELAFTAWRHPHMPWDEAHLLVLGWSSDGPMGDPEHVAGERDESIFQPRYSPDGHLTFVSDRSGWWNLHQLEGSKLRSLCSMRAEFGRAQWVFGMSTYDFITADEILCVYTQSGRDQLARLQLTTSKLVPIDSAFTSFDGIHVEAGQACFLAASERETSGVCSLDLESHRTTRLRVGSTLAVDEAYLSAPEAIEFRSAGGRTAHAFFYPPRNPEAQARPGEKPPLLVKSHGGPTAATRSDLDLRIQYWTSRGIAVVDVNYAGSTGYGRAYRDQLLGQWGVADVEDCTYAALYLAERGDVDRERLAISGGSAGGYTTLCALTFRDEFSAGASHYGIGDLEALVRDTHKFESRYTDNLVAPYPEARAVYVERSPIHFASQLNCPVIFFQGLEDQVVPPNQAEAMVAALARRGIRHAYVAFPGEQHGFRRAENICTALDGELYFYSRVFGFEVAERPEAVRIED
jgi:dipeptidyl aminopeptidase/acylaminoacyl peptidase